MIVFPAIDIQDGKAVRLRRGDFDDVTVFSDDPVALARQWQDEGAEALHVVDLDAARTGELVNVEMPHDRFRDSHIAPGSDVFVTPRDVRLFTKESAPG